MSTKVRWRGNKKNMQQRRLAITLIGLFAPLIIACGQIEETQLTESKTYTGPYPFSVTATVAMVADAVGNVAKDRANVKTLIGAGVDPHLYTPTRADVAALMTADIVFYCGLLLEGRMTDVLAKVGRKRPVCAIAERLDPAYVLRDSSGHADPHVWMDVAGWMKAVEVVIQTLSAFDPAHEQEYRSNGRTYLQELQALDAYATNVLATIPAEKRVLVTAHDAFNYLGRAYGLEVVGIQGLSTESEAGVQDLNRLVDLLVTRKIPAIFVESSVSDKNVRALIEGASARGHQVVIGGELFSDAMGPAGTYEGTYLGMIDHNATTIARALGGHAPQRGMQGKLTMLQR